MFRPIFGACPRLGSTCGRQPRQGSPTMPGHAHLATSWATDHPTDAIRILLRDALQHPNLRFVVSSVGGSAMHMERPDDVGREAGIG